MTLTLGRIGGLNDPERWDFTGQSLSLSGTLVESTLADLLAARQQLLGLVDNPDEPVIPLTWDQDSTADGFYRVTGVSVPTIPASYNANWLPYTVSLERVSTYASPLIEEIHVGAERTNEHGATEDNPFVCAPDSATYFDLGVSVGDSTKPWEVVIDTADGAGVRYARTDPGNLTVPYEVTTQMRLAPADYYDASCKLKIGSGLPTIVGRQAAVDVDDWELTNELIRVTGRADGAIGIERWTSSWQTEIAWMFLADSTSTGTGVEISNWSDITVLRNSPEFVAVRLTGEAPAHGDGYTYYTLDIGLRRGGLFANTLLATATGAGGFGDSLGLKHFAGGGSAGTTLGSVMGGYETSGVPAWFVFSDKDLTAHATDPFRVGAVETAIQFGLGMIVRSSQEDYDGIYDDGQPEGEYFAAQATRQVVSAR